MNNQILYHIWYYDTVLYHITWSIILLYHMTQYCIVPYHSKNIEQSKLYILKESWVKGISKIIWKNCGKHFLWLQSSSQYRWWIYPHLIKKENNIIWLSSTPCIQNIGIFFSNHVINPFLFNLNDLSPFKSQLTIYPSNGYTFQPCHQENWPTGHIIIH